MEAAAESGGSVFEMKVIGIYFHHEHKTLTDGITKGNKGKRTTPFVSFRVVPQPWDSYFRTES